MGASRFMREPGSLGNQSYTLLVCLGRRRLITGLNLLSWLSLRGIPLALGLFVSLEILRLALRWSTPP